MVEEAEALLRWVVAELSSEVPPEEPSVEEDLDEQPSQISGLWRSTRRTD